MSFQFFPTTTDPDVEREAHRHVERLRFLREQLELEIQATQRYVGERAIQGATNNELTSYADELNDQIEPAHIAFEGFYAFLLNDYHLQQDDSPEADDALSVQDGSTLELPLIDTGVIKEPDDEPVIDAEAERVANMFAFLRLHIRNRGLDPAEPFEINIGAIAREQNNGQDLSLDDFHELIQWLNRQPFVIGHERSYYTIQLPDAEPASTSRTEIPLSAPTKLLNLIMGSPNMAAKLHINQVCELLGLYGLGKGQKREFLLQLAASNLFVRDGQYVVVAPIGHEPVPNEPSEPEVSIQTYTAEQVLMFIDNQKFRHITELCMREEGARTEELKAAIEEIFGEFTHSEYEEFKQVGFPETRDLILQLLSGHGVMAEWKQTGRNRGKRYKIVIDNLKDTAPATADPTPSRPLVPNRAAPTKVEPITRMERFARRDTHEKDTKPTTVVDLTERERGNARQVIDRIVGSQPTKKAEVVKILEKSGIDAPRIDLALGELVMRGVLTKIKQGGSVYYTHN